MDGSMASGDLTSYLGLLLDRGGPLMIPILACSVLGIAAVVDRLIFLWWTFEQPDRVYLRVEDLLREGRRQEALHFCTRSRGALARTLGAGLTQLDRSEVRMEEVLAVVGQEQLFKLERRLRPLEVMATITPLLGLLGTVTGMMQAFRRVSSMPDAVSPSLLAGGIWEALLTTAAGLTVAIPLLVFLHYFDRRREKTANMLEKYSTLFMHLREDLRTGGEGAGDSAPTRPAAGGPPVRSAAPGGQQRPQPAPRPAPDTRPPRPPRLAR